MTANQATFPTQIMAEALGVSRSGFYAWRDRPPSTRAVADAAMTARIETIHRASRETYGAPRIHAELADEGIHVGRKRVERLMKAADLKGVSRRKFVKTTMRDERVRPAKDLVDRNFYAAAPNILWVADITYVPTWTGFLYLAVVLDAFSRRIVGWAMGHNLKAQLVLDALNMAIAQRKPQDVIHHSDQGSQYTSIAFGLRCKEADVRPSMGSVGDAYDNAMCESFFATLECELLDRRKFKTKAEARMAIFQFIEGWYNPGRRHSALGYKSPINYERSTAETLDSASP
jgi:putative transposase